MRKRLPLSLKKGMFFLTCSLFSLLAFTQNDLSLSKTVDLDSVGIGDTVTFTLVVTNDGATTVNDVEVADTLPSSLYFLSYTATSGFYDEDTGLWSIGTIQNTTTTDTLTITVIVEESGVITNLAEISNMLQADDDSVPDNKDYTEDDLATACVSVPIKICPRSDDTVRLEARAGLTDYEWYDGPTLISTDSIIYVTSAGRYTWTASSITTGCSTGLCCAAVVEEECFDLALIKTIGSSEADAYINTGEDFTFDITIINQGDIAADSLWIVDYIPTGMSLNDGAWTDSTTFATILLAEGSGLSAGGLLPGMNVTVSITLKLDSTFSNNTKLINVAEIEGAEDRDDNYLSEDTDSYFDDNLGNDNYFEDNEIQGNGKKGEDEDDHDRACIFTNPFDLALYKELAPGQDQNVEPGDTVVFRIYVVNQGYVDAQNIEITDSIPDEMSLADPDWTLNGDLATFNFMSTLSAGETDFYDIHLLLEAPLDPNTTITNWAEISYAEDTEGNVNPDDVDSNPDDDFENDVYLIDNYIDGDGKSDGDEDDHDGAEVYVKPFDLALYKQLAPGQDADVAPGDTVTFRIFVVNQGEITADFIRIVDYIPSEMTLEDADWALDGLDAIRLLNAGDELSLSGLEPAEEVFVDIKLKLKSPLTPNTTVINYAEITSAEDDAGNEQTDIDSDPDQSQDDLLLVDNYIDGNGMNGGDEDDHDKAEVVIEPFDLALYKELGPGQSAVVEPGDTVTFRIWIINQGEITTNNVLLVDYYPDGMTPIADGVWLPLLPNITSGVLSAGTGLPADGLDPGETSSIDIQFVIDAPLPADSVLQNWAEILFATDDNFNLVEDWDSTPDFINSNDKFILDNEILGNGKGGEDEDDHDVAEVTIANFDLALYKDLAPGEDNSVVPGDMVDYLIIVVNQGDIIADNIVISDSIPSGMALMDADWVQVGDIATRTLNSGDELPIGGLLPGQTDTVTITLEVPNPLPTNSRLVNWAEITDATDEDGNAMVDSDSDMDDDFENDKYILDNYIDGNGMNGGDEDDHDPAEVMYEVFDIALRKTVENTEPVQWGDDVTFIITIFNQGTIAAQDIEIYDWIPDGFELSVNDYNGWLYAGSPDILKTEIEDVIDPGDSAKVNLVLTVLDNYCLEDLNNIAEVVNQEDEFGQNMNDEDIDSTPDKDPTNDEMKDDVIVEDGKNMVGDDEDDNDPQEPPVFDLALRLTTTQMFPVRIGDEVHYDIKIFNQGNIKAQNTEVKVTFPNDFSLSGSDTNGWTDNGDGTASLVLTDMVARDDSIMTDILLVVGNEAEMGDLIAHAEIQSAEDMTGADMTLLDIDSDYDMATDDLLIDDEINSCGLTDEDDHDIAEVELFDLALRKTPDSNVPAQWLEDVSFTITIFNQSPKLSATNIELIDYIPEGFILSPNDVVGWADLDSLATYTYTGTIAPGDSAAIQILLQVEKGTDAGFYENTSEITAAEDSDNRDLTDYDYDSVPDTDVGNDYTTDDVIYEHGGREPDEDEDDHDIAEFEVEIIDLALRKTTEQDVCVLYGQDVDFTMTVFNQGSRTMQEVSLIDYVPSGFKLSPADSSGWVFNGGNATATLTMHKTIAPGDSAKIDIRLRVEQGAAPYTFANRAEIVSAQDDSGQDRTGDDIDSDWDTLPDNDLLEDDVIDQMANMGGTDEDDHDIESVDIFDLALRKTTPVSDKVTVGWDVPFTIEIFNQGMVYAQNVGLIDHLPYGFSLSPSDTSGWVDNFDGTISNTYTDTIAPQASVLVQLLLRVEDYAEAGVFENIAEITYAEDSTGTDRSDLDVDSDYDTIADNDNYVDDEIHDDGDVDEDDNDRAEIEVEIIDIALRKITQFNDQEPVIIGDDVHFGIEVFNQGSYPIDTIDIVDYIPEGFYLSPMDGNGWTVVGDKAYNTIIGPLDTMQSKSIGIVLRVDSDASPDNLINGAEVIRIIDEDGDDRSKDDRDSDPDEMPDNDDNVDDEIDEQPPVDEDDHDIEAVPVFDLALRKTTDITEPVTVGDTATFTITIYNQGNLKAQEIDLIDHLPEGFGLSGSDSNGWSDDGDGTASNSLAGPLEIGDSMKVDIELIVLDTAEAGIFYNIAEITGAQDSTGVDRTDYDLDSDPDEDSGNDNLTDNIIDENGQGANDEDDHDHEPIEVEIIDLALRKTTDHVDPVEVGDDVIFEIEVLNQGSVVMDSITIIDHYPPGFILSPADGNNWTDNGDGTASVTLPSDIDPGMNYTIGIVLRLDDKEELGSLYNVAELTYFEDDSGEDRTEDDRDSEADDIPDNDDIVDNEVDETPPTDEDDHDTAEVWVDGYDLALRKTLTEVEPHEPGDTLTFQIDVFNQGTLTAYDIQINEYIPTGMSLVDANWTEAGGIATLNTAIPWLNAGDSTTLTVDLKIDDDFMEEYLTNYAEVKEFFDGVGGSHIDEDSTPDNDEGNDFVVDNEINEEPPVDEDDHDEEGFNVKQTFDLALYKKLATGQPNPVEPGDTVRFTIFVVNQGTLNAYNIEVTDYVPADMIYETALNTSLMTSNANDWGADSTYMIAGPLSPGDTTSIDIILVIDEDSIEDMLENEAEVSAADDDTDDMNTPRDDEDSDLDDVNDDFIGGNNFINNENMDEDDHDYEPISLIEVPLGSIAGLAWLDCDSDGINNGEDALADVPVMLLGTESDGDPVNESTTTAGDGTYAFINIKPGDYYIKFGYPTDPTGLGLTLQNQGGDDTIDSDAHPTTGETHFITLFGNDVTDVDAGYQDIEAPGIQPVDPLFDTAMSGDTIMVECDDVPTLDKDDVIVWDNITDSMDIEITYTDSILYVADSCALEGFIEIHKCTWTAVDDCDNESEFCLYIKVQDTTAPVLVSAPPAIDTIECGDPEPMDLPVFDDNCDDDLHWEAISSISIVDSCEYLISRSWTVYDDCGNSNSFGQTIHVLDRTAPVIVSSPPSDITVECGDPMLNEEPVFDDACSDSLTITLASSIMPIHCGEIIQRTWTATDDCGHETTFTQNITVEDTTAPEIHGVPDDIEAECGQVPNIVFNVTATDNCDPDPQLDYETEATGSDPCVGYDILHIWIATDSCDNVARDTFKIHVTDNLPPVLDEVPADITIECGTTPPNFEEPDVFDLCDGNVMVVPSVEESGTVCNKQYLYIWTATDDCGNTVVDTTIVTLIDNTPPVLSEMPADTDVLCPDEVPGAPIITATDNCDDAVLVLADSTITGNQPCDYQIIRTWTAVDSCGNQVTHTQTITVKDDEAPVLTGLPADITLDCDEECPPPPQIGIIDNCDDDPTLLFEEEIEGDTTSCEWEKTWTWKAFDECNNLVEHTTTITFKDMTGPVITPIHPDLAGLMDGDTIMVECDNVPLPDANDVMAIDECNNVDTIILMEMVHNGDCLQDGYLFIMTCIWKAYDDCGNESTWTIYVKVQDTVEPELHNVPDDITVECDDVPDAPTNITATDNCDDDPVVTYDEVRNDGNCEDNYELVRTWYATDECGNVASESQIVTVQDTTDPVFTNVPADVTIECDDPLPTGDPTATDNCDDDVTIDFNETEVPGDCIDEKVITRTWTATDNCGNTATVSQVITIEDNTAPELHDVPASVTIECDEALPTDAPTATDNCDTDIEITLTETEVPGNCPQEKVITRTWTATDNCGNTDEESQTITIVDTTDPILTNIPSDVTIECDEDLPTDKPDVSDNCDSAITVVIDDDRTDGICIDEYVITRTFTATDDCGNSATATQTITVEDNTAPVFVNVPQDITVNCDEIPDETDCPATDNCDDDLVLLYEQDTIGSIDSCIYQLKRQWKAVDNCGNQTDIEQIITVQDTEGPVITPTHPSLAGVMDGDTIMMFDCQGLPVLDETDVDVTDNCCDDVDVTFEEFISQGDCEQDGYLMLMKCGWIATDCCGNESEFFIYIIVKDETPPMLIGVPDDVTVECDDIPDAPLVTAMDNCDNDLDVQFTEDEIDGNCEDEYQIIRTWYVIDDCGNETEATQVVTVEDNSAPNLLNIPADVTIQCDDTLPTDEPIGSDNCDDEVDITKNDVLTPGCPKIITRTWTATDNCGNVTTAEQIITLEDTVPPVIDAPADVTIECDEALPTDQAVVTDNCDTDVMVSMEETTEDLACGQRITRTWTATDECDNTSTATQIITLIDTTPPEFVNTPQDITVDCDNVPDPEDCVATDNCDPDVETSYSEIVDDSDPCAIQIKRIWTAEDDCGNTNSVEQLVTVVDDEAPVLTPIHPGLQGVMDGDTLTFECDDAIVFGLEDVEATDNCTDPSLEFVELVTSVGDCDVDGYLFIIRCCWIAEDDCGNMSEFCIYVRITDETEPMIMDIPDDITVECHEIPAPDSTITAWDECDDNVDILYSENIIPGPCEGTYTLERVWTAVDDCGNEATGTQIVNVEDTTPPLIIGAPDDLTVECDNVPAPDTSNVKAVDNCDPDPTIVFEETMTGDCPYTLTRTWTATDDCGNTSMETQVITVDDTTMPELVGVPANADYQCTDEVPDPADVTATDNCDDDPDITFNETTDGDDCDQTITRTWTATDECGNTIIESQTITIMDDIAPVLTGVPADITVNCEDIPDANGVTATDNCDSNVDLVLGEEMTQGCPYTITRTWTATDDCGNVTTDQQIITVFDDEMPVFVNPPADITVDCTEIPDAEDCPATDNCDDDLEFTYLELVGTGDCEYEIKRIWSAEDDCGNVAIVEQLITVVDESAPELIFTHPLLVGLGDGDVVEMECDSLELFGADDAIAVDECDSDASVMFMEGVPEIGDCETDGFISQIMCTWIAKDDCGNSDSITLTIRIVDTKDPIFTGIPDDITIECEDDIPAVPDPTVDDCSDVTVDFDESTDVNGCTTTITRTWTATDDCGNTATESYTITQTDNTGPVFVTGVADLSLDCDDQIPTDPPVVTDACGAIDLDLDEQSSVNGCTTTITRVWTATDQCGNSTEATQIITITDNDAPVLTGVPADLTVDVDAGQTVPDPATVTASDNCTSSVTPTFDETQDPSDCQNIITRTWTATDDCGNTISETQVITVLMNNLNIQLISSSAETCAGNDGTAELSPQNLTYVWSDGGSGFMRTDLTEGTYTVTGTSTANCSNTITVIIANDCDCIEPQIDQIVSTSTTCGEDNGSATVDVVGNASDFTFTWSPNVGTDVGTDGNSKTDLPAGTYEVTISNPLFVDCEKIVQFTVGDSTPPAYSSDITAATCAGDDGAVSFSPLTYTYTWDNFVGATRTGLAPGSYSVTITTIDLCEEVIIVQVPSECDCIDPILDNLALTPTTCGENNGAATINLTEDESLYSFDWVPDLGTPVGTSGNQRVDLPAGDYLVVVIYDNNSMCELKLNFTIDSSDAVVVTVAENNPATCVGNDGDVVLSPDNLTYNWSDGGSGSQRDDLVAGVYSVTATDNNGCTSIFDVEVLNNGLMNVEIETNDPADCDEENAYVVLGPDSYSYAWSDGGSGYWRDDLPAGTYTVTATAGIPGCTGVVTVIVDEIGCKDCPSIFYTDTMTVSTLTDTTAVCIPIPFMTINNYDLEVDGVPYTLPIDDCNTISVVFYTYSTLTLGNWTGPFAIDWTLNGASVVDTVNSIDDLVTLMNSVDTMGFWMNDVATSSLVGGDMNANYGNLNIVDIPTTLSFSTQPNFTSIPMGSEILIPGLGTFELIATDPASDCMDTLIIVIEQGPAPLPGNFISAEFAAVGMNCNYDSPSVCVEIPYNDMGDYIITINGQPFNGDMEPCNFEANRYYNYLNLPGLGNDGPYTIEGWTVNGNPFFGTFNNVDELLALMNQWDDTGIWELDLTGYNILGGNTLSDYGPMTISHQGTGIISVIEVNSNYLPNSTALILPPGMNELIVTRLVDGMADTLTAAIACVTPEHMYNEIMVNQQDTICLDSDELMGEIMTISNICEDQSGNAEFSIIPGTTCVSCVGMDVGYSEACFVICDEYGLCDTTYLEVDVRALEWAEPTHDTLYIDINTAVTADIIANDYVPDQINEFKIIKDPEHGTVTINADGTITYEPYDEYCNSYPSANLDFFMYEICTDAGCVPSVVYIEVDCGDLVIHTGFSPNGDGVNDFFVIKGLGNYPEHKLCVFNRWGTKVFCTEHYQNDWGGTWNSNDLPNGTYFFVLDLGDDDRYTGYVQLNR